MNDKFDQPKIAEEAVLPQDEIQRIMSALASDLKKYKTLMACSIMTDVVKNTREIRLLVGK